MSLKELVELSRYYGRNSEYVVGGGGNSSFKDERYLFIKPSGTTLADLSESAMARMRRDRLREIWGREYPRKAEERERRVLEDLMAAREDGEQRRPSVETLLHELFPQPFVVHTHPALANGLTCGRRGAGIASALFPRDALWVPVVNPGYLLAVRCKRAVEERVRNGGGFPRIIFLQNHGVVISGQSADEIRSLYDGIQEKLGAIVQRRPDLTEESPADPDRVSGIGSRLGELWGGEARFLLNREILGLVSSRRSFRPLASFSYTPDHIVYCGHEPLWLGRGIGLKEGKGGISGAVAAYRKRNGHWPRVAAVEGLGVFARGETAGAMFVDALKVSVYAESFGGPSLMPRRERDFIRTWEVERFRARVAKEGKTE
jgi:rhamnose utilization protein RhaD (predicted bifunctional aldolase and dehydrogenase)